MRTPLPRRHVYPASCRSMREVADGYRTPCLPLDRPQSELLVRRHSKTRVSKPDTQLTCLLMFADVRPVLSSTTFTTGLESPPPEASLTVPPCSSQGLPPRD